MQLCALFRLAFASAPGLKSLTLLQTVTRRTVLQKVRRQTCIRHSPPTDCKHTVSGSISLPSRGAFHLSLTVLVHYRSPGVFSLGRWSSRIPTGFHVSRGTRVISYGRASFSPTGLSPSMARLSSALRLKTKFAVTSTARPQAALQPLICNACRLHTDWFGLFPFRSPLLRESRLFLFLRVLRCFSSPGSLLPLCIHLGYRPLPPVGCPIRKSPDQSLLAAPRGFSQLATSFFGS